MSGHGNELDRVLDSAMNGILAKLNAALDPEAGLADVYARSARRGPGADTAVPGRDSTGSSRLEQACDQIDLTAAWLAGLIESGQRDPFAGSSFLELARDSLVQLRAGLAARNLARPEARQLTSDIQHQFVQADRILRTQQATTLDQLASTRTSRTGSLTDQVRAIRDMVARLYEPDGHDLTLAPTR
jgi:hypothetical protein